MRISIFGLGYVGAVSAACLARDGHEVIGVDINPMKVQFINDGCSPISEESLDTLIRQGVEQGRLHATTDSRAAVLNSEISLICVGTPSHDNGSLDLTAVRRVCREIGEALAEKQGEHIVVVRSTVLPGTTHRVVVPELEQASSRRVGEGLGVCVAPEFLREGSSVEDFYHPPFTLIGQEEARVGERVARLFAAVEAPVIYTSIPVAEMVKYVCNAYHALKVAFANEIGAICKQLGIDSHEVMDIFCLDRKLNISTAYLRPGFAFGGSCLPKDLRALLYAGHHLDLQLPLLEAVLPSNELQIRRAWEMIQRTGKKQVGVLGLSFKPGTDDLRESPMVALTERLIGKGYTVWLYDRYVSWAKLHGANKAYIEREIPHISRLLCAELEEVVERSEVLVIGHRFPERDRLQALLRADQVVIDLVRLSPDGWHGPGRYEGICW